MFKFLLKVVVVAAVVVGLLGYLGMKKGNLSFGNININPQEVLSKLPIDMSVVGKMQSMQPDQVKGQVSEALDALVTHPGRNSGPVVLGVKVSNDTIGTVTDVLMGLPSDQLDQVKSVICTP